MPKKEMLINVSEGEECRIALVEDGRLEELYMERTSSTSHVGNVYKGRVTNVEPSIQAAFVDFGLGRNGFLHISDLMPTYFGGKAEEVVESVGRKMARRDRPPIQKCLKRGDEIIVQIIKEGIGTKGPTLSTYISIPGRILVMMPGMTKLGVSRKIEDEEERKRLRIILDGLKPPKDCGFIIRTAGVGKTKAEIERDLKYLTRLYENINKKAKSISGPVELYAEGDLVTRTVRDVMTSDVDRIVVDNEAVAKKIKEFFKLVAPRTKNKVDLYEEPVPLFHKYGIEKEIELMYSRHVPLPSGGSLVIDSTEAIVAIDVNSGKFRDHSDAETTAFKTDLEAADEIPRQLRLRDLGGVIICDFIDLRFERHRRDLEKRLHDNLKNDRAKTKMLRMSQFGIIEMTRQRMRPSLKRSIYSDCPHCRGAGLVKTSESMCLDVMRRLAIGIHDQRVARIELAVSAEVSFFLQNRKRAQLSAMEAAAGKRVLIRVDPSLGLDEMRMELYDSRDGLVYLPELGMAPAEPQGQQQQGRRGQGQHRQEDRHRDQRRGRDQRGRDQRGRRGDHRRDQEEAEQRLADVEEQVDQREEDRAHEADEQSGMALPSQEPMSPEVSIEAAPPPLEEDAGALEEPQARSAEAGQEEFEAAEEPLEQRRPEPVSHQRPLPEAPQEEYSEDIELQPAGISHERPSRKQHGQNRRGGRGGRRGGRSGGSGGGGGGGGRHAMHKPEVAPTPRAGEMSLAERWALEEAAEKARQRQQPPNRPQQPQQHYPQQGDNQPRYGDQGGGQGGGGGGRRRRRRRRGRGGGGGGQGQGGGNYDQGPAPAPSNVAPTSPATQPTQQPVQRSGSTDRHLLHDEPVLPQPLSRPRSYRDLDQIPDDLD